MHSHSSNKKGCFTCPRFVPTFMPGFIMLIAVATWLAVSMDTSKYRTMLLLQANTTFSHAHVGLVSDRTEAHGGLHSSVSVNASIAFATAEGDKPTFPLNPKARHAKMKYPRGRPAINGSEVSIWVHDPVECQFISGFILRWGTWSQHLMDDIVATVNPSPDNLFADIGANLGAFSLVMARLGFKVASFEPMPYNLELFRQSIAENKFSSSIALHEVAVGDKEADKVCMEPAQKSFPKINQGNGRISDKGSVCVPLKRVDSLLGGRCPDAVKVDVEVGLPYSFFHLHLHSFIYSFTSTHTKLFLHFLIHFTQPFHNFHGAI